MMNKLSNLPSLNKPARLYFVDAMRAVAILMMLQGHFIYSLLGEAYRDPENVYYSLWLYGRGITAPLFFTVSGFIFMYLLVRKPYPRNLDNPRVKKGIRRGLQLVFIGYLLRLNVLLLFSGKINSAFWMVDVLHCIGFGLLFLVGIYLLFHRGKGWLSMLVLLASGLLIFLFQPAYGGWTLESWPKFLANYLTRANGSVFTLLPWIGYSAWGAFLAMLFRRINPTEKVQNFMAVGFLLVGFGLIWYSSGFLMWLYHQSGFFMFKAVAYNNFLFIRLGNVFFLFGLFMAFRHALKGKLIVEIGQHTLGIYVLHFVVLYGSFVGLGLTDFFYRSLSPVYAITGAVLFMVFITWAVLIYYRKDIWGQLVNWSKTKLFPFIQNALPKALKRKTA